MFSRKSGAIPLLFAIACLGGCGNDDDGTHRPSATCTVGGHGDGSEQASAELYW